MRRVVAHCAFILVTGWASAAAAQSLAVSTADPAVPDLRAIVAEAAADSTPAQQAQTAGQPAAAPAPTRYRRRGSVVGYIDDPVIASKVRVRFDAAYENLVPDRAEFFYAKCGCYQDLDPGHPAFDPDAPGPRPGAANDIRYQQLYLSGEYAFSSHFSAFAQLPFRWIQPQSFIPGTGDGFGDQSGIDDIRAGVKAGLVATDERSVTGQVRFFFPTGDASKGLGTDHASMEPALLIYNRVHPLVALESQIGLWVPFGGAEPVPTGADDHFAGNVFFWGIGGSVAVHSTELVQIAPVVELVAWHVLGGNQTAPLGDASDSDIVNLKVGGRVAYGAGSFYVGYGFALTDDTWYDDILRFEYRFDF